MKYDNIVIEKSGGIQCDSCDWNDPNVPTTEYSKWVNKPCEKCGANLLTQEDFDRTEVFMKAIDAINQIPPDQLEKLYENMTPDQIIDSYLQLKDFGMRQVEGDNWTYHSQQEAKKDKQ